MKHPLSDSYISPVSKDSHLISDLNLIWFQPWNVHKFSQTNVLHKRIWSRKLGEIMPNFEGLKMTHLNISGLKTLKLEKFYIGKFQAWKFSQMYDNIRPKLFHNENLISLLMSSLTTYDFLSDIFHTIFTPEINLAQTSLFIFSWILHGLMLKNITYAFAISIFRVFKHNDILQHQSLLLSPLWYFTAIGFSFKTIWFFWVCSKNSPRIQWIPFCINFMSSGERKYWSNKKPLLPWGIGKTVVVRTDSQKS